VDFVDGKGRSTSTTDRRVVIGSIPDGTADDVDQAAKAARAAFDAWSQTSPEERGQVLYRIGEGLAARMTRIATIVTREAGMPSG